MTVRGNVAFLVKTFSKDESSYWLTDELIHEFSKIGYKVDVYLVDIKEKWGNGIYEVSKNITLYSYNVSREGGVVNRLFKLVLANLRIKRQIVTKEYKLIINFSIASVFWGVSRRVKSKYKPTKCLLVIWDFFPIHQLQINKIKAISLLKDFLYNLENAEVTGSDSVALMSARNITFFKDYHPNYSGESFILRLWGNHEKCELSYYGKGAESEVLNFVFGGQLSRGRGIELLCDFAHENRDLEGKIKIHIVGDGELTSYVRDRVKDQELKIIELHSFMSRESYRSFISKMDVGVVITVPGVTVPTFPSKVIDYMICGLPVFSCVEKSSDFGEFVSDVARCGLSANVENMDEFRLVIEKFIVLKAGAVLDVLGANGTNYFLANMTAVAAVEKIKNELQI